MKYCPIKKKLDAYMITMDLGVITKEWVDVHRRINVQVGRRINQARLMASRIPYEDFY